MTLGHRRARRRGMLVGAAISSSRAKKQAAAPAGAPATALPNPQPTPTEDLAAQLKQLAELRDKGILTEDEFSAKKKQLLGL